MLNVASLATAANNLRPVPAAPAVEQRDDDDGRKLRLDHGLEGEGMGISYVSDQVFHLGGIFMYAATTYLYGFFASMDQ